MSPHKQLLPFFPAELAAGTRHQIRRLFGSRAARLQQHCKYLKLNHILYHMFVVFPLTPLNIRWRNEVFVYFVSN